MKILSVFLIVFFTSDFVTAQWVTLNSGTTENLYSIHFTSSDTGFAAGAYGTILKTTNGGVSWVSKPSGVTSDLNSIFFSTPDSGYIVGGNYWQNTCVILKTTNAGNNWTVVHTDTSSYLHSVYFVNTNVGYAVGSLGRIKMTTDGGNNWSTYFSSTNARLYSVCFISNDTGYVVGTSNTILKTEDGGISWSIINSTYDEHLYSLYFKDSIGYAVGWSNTNQTAVILKSSDYGNNWTSQATNISEIFTNVFFVNDTTGFVCSGFGGNIYKTIDSGINWIQQSSGTSEWKSFIFFTNIDTGYVVGDNGIILKTTNSGFGLTPFNKVIEICIGDSTLLSIQAQGGIPPYNYIWSNSDTSNSIWVNPISSISYYVTAYDNNFNSVSTQFSIIVNNPIPPTITQIGNQLKSSSAQTYQWYLNGTIINNATTQIYTPLQNGEYTVYVKGNNGCYATSSIYNLLNYGFVDFMNNSNLFIYPNPTRTNLTIEFPQKSEIEISNINGQVIKTIHSDSTKTMIDISDLSGGVYIVRLKTDREIITNKILKE
jgi:photosystem II stability/assembly factor-like uncharacterized protein